MNTCKNIIKKRMQDIGETQESLAEKLSVSQGSIAHWLSGTGGRKPDTDIIASMLNAVGIRELIINADGSASENNMQNKLNKNNFQIEGLDIKASVGAAYLNSDIKEVIKLV
ncbi:helix-turn-helix transcriptional regulator [Gilliamella sp. ESL0405]|uniref:helix-turn-helix domain-containing protein n=1 Tax=Gilliamella sp. ESL0405 TaxID=2704653 RepID=UPI001C6A232C|nr:helix-turn-helix transcriptional regulator [Gilliamella sp. ESL0405]QYN46868.1 helix-turn-helix transcriptional regulator [Gilliamella sp. ESL0405]